ncbi:MAG: tyrosine--tRNA ligase [Clostridiales bacterium]|nr:tyrosine--tRNA ligase [Clostridiales bacterium]
MGVYEDLVARGLVAQTTNEDNVRELVNNGDAVFYIGYDATADSLHVGHYLQLSTTARLQRAGNKPIVLIGGGTTLIGDPSGRNDMRKLMTRDDINHNADCFRAQMKKFIDFGEGGATMVDNADWLLDLNFLDFMRSVGVHFSVNRMLTAENYKNRLEKGLSFFEMSYMLMQSYDFVVLNQQNGCNMQCGGDDQWSNIIWGADLVRRMNGKQAEGMTFSLLTTSEGVKMGKTQKGAVWLDPEKTSPYEFYQYWRNIDDADVIKCLKMLTFLPVEQIQSEFEGLEGQELNRAKEALAFELTSTVHSTEEAEKAKEVSQSVFSVSGVHSEMPTKELSADLFAEDRIEVLELLTATGIAPSKSEARRLVEQGGIVIDDLKVEGIDATVGKEQFKDGFVVVKKGKKNVYKVELV